MRLIDADELKKAITKETYNFKQIPIRVDEVMRIIDNAPTIEYTFEEAFQKTVCENRLYCPARPTGEWIIDGHHRRCKKCGEYFCMTDSEGNEIPSNFCPNCGADMRGKKE